MKFLVNPNNHTIMMWGTVIDEAMIVNEILTTLAPDTYTENQFAIYKNNLQELHNDPANLEFRTDINFYFKYDPLEGKIYARTDYEIAQKEGQELIQELSRTNTEYIKSRYSLERQITFLTLKVDALQAGREDIIVELDKVKQWCFDYPMAYYYQKEQEIKDLVEAIGAGTATLEDLQNHKHTWNFEQFDSNDFNLRIADILDMFKNPPV